jgi:AraC-like DNA-binding protein
VLLVLGHASIAQPPAVAPNEQIEIAYVQPSAAEFGAIYERLRSRRVLETLQAFLSPLRLDEKLVVKIDQCGATLVRYKSPGPVTLCYEYIEQVERLAPKATVILAQGPVTTESAVVGPVVQALLHDVAMAVFTLMDTPVWGRVDDAADRLAAFLMLQFGPDVAWNTVMGTAWFLAGNATAAPDFADVRGAVAQRYYTTLCVAYGGEQRKAFKVDPASLGTSQPLSEIAFACGFRDYTHFARKFRHRFGYSPGGRGEGHAPARDAIVRPGTGGSASRAHDKQPRET